MERAFRALIALTAFAGLGMQLWILLESPAFASDLDAGWRFLAFFTILTNLMVGMVSSVSAIAPNSALERILAGANTRAGEVLYIALGPQLRRLLAAAMRRPSMPRR